MVENEIEHRISALLTAGDLSGAATEGLRSYGVELLLYVRALVRDEEAARDAFAAVAEKVWKGLPGFRRDSSFRTWVYRIAWNAAHDSLRDGRRRREERLDTTEAGRIADEVRLSTPFCRRTEARERLAQLAERLDLDERSLLVLRIEQKLSWREVAGVMALDEGAVKKRFERLRTRLREMAQREGQLPSTGNSGRSPR